MLLAYQNALELAWEREKPISEDQYTRMREIYRGAFAQAVKEAEAKNWLKEKPQLKKSITNLGEKIGNRYAANFDSKRTLFAKKWLWIAARESQLTWLGWIAEGLVEDSPTTRGYSASLEAEHSQGSLFCAVYMKFSEAAYVDVIQQEGKFKDNFDYGLKYSISAVWFCEADALMGSGNKEGALDKLEDAYFALIQGVHNQSGEEAISSSQRRAAKGRHAETYELEDKIIAYWRDNISIEHTNELAAELLQKEFPEVAHRTLVRYVSKAKKLPPAGTL